MTEYTKGPWVFEFGHDMRGNVKYWQVHEGNHAVCNNQFCYAASDEDESIANARLISAAPDMLEALEALVVAVEREAKIEGVSGIACEKLPFARSAIAKAKGQ